jgi:hypothetical protein
MMPCSPRGNTDAAEGARVFIIYVSTLQRLVSFRPVLLGASAQIPGVGVPASDSLSYSRCHSFLSIAEIVGPENVVVSNVVGMIGTGLRLA